MTGLEVAGVNLRIEDVITPEEYEHRTSQHEDVYKRQALSAASSCAACISSTHGLWQTLPS